MTVFSWLLARTIVLFTLLTALNAATVHGFQEDARSLISMTNAQRLARGLSPNRPQLRRSVKIKGRGMSATLSPSDSTSASSSPTSTSSSASTTPTPPAPCPFSGYIELSGAAVGYLSQSNAQGSFGAASVENAGIFTIDLCSYPTSPINIGCTNCNGDTVNGSPGFTVIGGVLPPGSTGTLTSNPATPGALLSLVKPVSSGPPSTIPVSAWTEQVESMIWLYDTATQQITAQWTNPDGSLPPTYILWFQQRLSFSSTNPFADLVALTFVPIASPS